MFAEHATHYDFFTETYFSFTLSSQFFFSFIHSQLIYWFLRRRMRKAVLTSYSIELASIKYFKCEGYSIVFKWNNECCVLITIYLNCITSYFYYFLFLKKRSGTVVIRWQVVNKRCHLTCEMHLDQFFFAYYFSELNKCQLYYVAVNEATVISLLQI